MGQLELTDSSSGVEKSGGSWKTLLVITGLIAAAAVATLKPWHPQVNDENTRIIENADDIVIPKPAPALRCTPSNNQALKIAEELAKKLQKCCRNVTKKWDGQPEEVMSQFVIEAIAECSDIPTNPCAFDVNRLDSALKVCRKGEAM